MDPSALNHSSFFSSNHSLLHQLPQPDFLSQQLNPSAQTIITGAQLEQLESGSPSSTTTASRRPRKKMRGGADTGELLSDDDVLTSEEGGFDDADGDEAKPNATDLAKRSTRVKGKGKAKDEDEEESDFGGPGGAAGATTKKAKGKKSGDKKKKAGRACGVCQKAHLTCDDGRPCIRCIKKGCPEKCQDGARKKAKYLQEIPDELLERRPPTVAVTVEESPAPTAPTQVDDNSPPSSLFLSLTPITEQDSHQPDYLDPTNSLSSLLPSQNPPTSQPDPSPQPFNFDSMPYYDNTFSNEFGSEAANLEYAILSSMLNGNGFSLDTYGNSTSTGEQPGSRVMSPLGGNMGLHQPPGEFGGGLFGSTKAETETNGGQYGTDDLFSLGEASGVGAGS
ncbi:transcription factor, partial [Pseudohyphozyma bogoriensis]